MPHLPNSTIFVVGNRIMTSGDFVFEAEQESLDTIIEDFGPPIINFITPSIFMEGERITVTMSSHRPYTPLQLAVQGSGVTASNPQVVSDTQITIDVTVDANAMAERDNADLGDARDVRVVTLAGATDDSGRSLEQSTIAENLITIYFGPPSLTSVSEAFGAIIHQGDIIALNVSGDRMYHKKFGGAPQDMTLSVGGAGEMTMPTNPTVEGRASASIGGVQVSSTATRGQKSATIQTYSGVATLNNAVEVFFSAPELTALKMDDGTGTFVSVDPSNNNNVLAAGDTKTLRLEGNRFEGIDENAANVKLGKLDANGVFTQLATAQDGSVYDLSSGASNLPTLTPLATQTGLQANYTGLVGTGDHYDVELAVPSDMPTDLFGLCIQVTTLAAAGSQKQNTGNSGLVFLQIDAAAPVITSVDVAYTANDPRDAGETKATVADGQTRTVTITGTSLHGALNELRILDQSSGLGTVGSSNNSGASGFGITVANYTKVSGTEATFDLTIDDSHPSIELSTIGVQLFTDIGDSVILDNGPKIEVLAGAPSLNASEQVLFRPNSGTDIQTLIYAGDNLYNVLDSSTGGSFNAFSGAFPSYFSASGKLGAGAGAQLSDMSGVSAIKVFASAKTLIAVEITLGANATINSPRDLTISTRTGSVTLANAIDVVPEDPTMASSSITEMMEGTTHNTVALTGTNYFPTGPAVLDAEEIYFVDPQNAFVSDVDFSRTGATPIDPAQPDTWAWNVSHSFASYNIQYRKVDLLNGTDGRQLQFVAPAGFEVGILDMDYMSDTYGDSVDHYDPEAWDDPGGSTSGNIRSAAQSGLATTWAAQVTAVEGDIVVIRPNQAGDLSASMTITDVSGLANPPAPKSIPLRAYVPTPEEDALEDLRRREEQDGSSASVFQAYADGNSAHGATMNQEQFDEMAIMVLISSSYATDIRGGVPTDPNNGLTQALVQQAAAWFMTLESQLTTLKADVLTQTNATFDAAQDAQADQHIADAQAHYAAVQALIDETDDPNSAPQAGFKN